MISHEDLTLDDSDRTFVRVTYVQIDKGIDMGGTLLVDRALAAALAERIEAVMSRTEREVDVELGKGERLRIYESGSDQCPILNVTWRRPPSHPSPGLSGLMLTMPYAERLVRALEGVRR